MEQRNFVDKIVKIGVIAFTAQRLYAAYKQRKSDTQAGLGARVDQERDSVDVASMGSFPASDPPSFSPSGGSLA